MPCKAHAGCTTRRSLALGALLLLALGLSACRPALVIRLSTRVFYDGSVERSVEVVGRTDEGKAPTDPDWLASSAGVRLAEPGAWARVEETPGRLWADGFFAAVEGLPPSLAMQTARGFLTGPDETSLAIEERVVLRRWSYSESHRDPLGDAARSQALDALAELVVEALDRELRDQLGDDVERSPAERLVRGEWRGLAESLLNSGKGPAQESPAARIEAWRRVLRDAGAPAASAEDVDEFWEAQLPLLLEWARIGVAGALSTPARRVTVEDLPLWPVGDDHMDRLMEIVGRVWGGDEQLMELVETHVRALMGYYGDDLTPLFRFEVRVEMPGSLLRTNGTPDQASVLWLFRDEELASSEVRLEAQSVEPLAEPLTALRARRQLDRAGLVQLEDLLWKRDPEGRLAELLAEAVQRQRLALLRDEAEVPDDLRGLAAELADLLDPEAPD